jgi:replicative DNA helicase
LGDIHTTFKNYVVNIEKNTILTGLPSLDAKIFLSTGANVGIIGAPGCHAKGTEVLMHDGTIKKVEDVIIGDKLMGPDSKPREVLKLCRGREEMVKIKPLRSPEFTVNKSHILHLSPSRLKHNKCIVGNLNIKTENYIKSVIGKDGAGLKGYKLIKSGVNFDKKELNIDPYILGIWLGDGHSNNPSLTTMDDEIRDVWINYGKSLNLRVTKQDQVDNKSSIYSLVDSKGHKNPLTLKFREYNLFNNKHIPFKYLTSSREDRLQLLAGLIDTDGSLEANKIGWNYVSKLEQLANDVVYLARSLGFHASINKKTKYCTYKGLKQFGEYYYVYISGTDCLTVPVKLKRKQPRIQKMKNNPLHQGFDYEFLPEDDFYGFTLDNDHLYLTADFFIHHNSGKTSIALDILNNTSKAGVKSVLASLDMHYNRLFEKVLYRISGLPRGELYDIFKNNQEDEIMKKLEVEFGNVNFFHKSTPTVQDIKDYILACEEESGEKVKLVMLDYFERVTTDIGDDTAASKRVAGELQDLVNDLDICLVTLVQPNKMALGGGPDNPITSYTSIKGSSYVYQAFRIIFSLWRPFYNPTDFSNDKYMQMAILKNDLGELSELTFGWNGHEGRITEIEDHEHQEFKELLMKKAEHKKNEKSGWTS